MKTCFKRFLSVLLVFMMVFGAMAGVAGSSFLSLRANAATENFLTLETRLYRYDSAIDEWVYTERAMPGEELKARLFIDTSYYTNAGEIIVFLNNEMFEDYYSLDTRYDLVVNADADSSAAINGTSGVFRKMGAEDIAVSQLVEYGYITHDFALQHTAYAMVYNFDGNICKKISGEEWFAEFDIRVKHDADGCDGMLIIPSTIMNPNDGYDAYINIPVGEAGGRVTDTVGMYMVEVDTIIINNPVSTTSTIRFDAAGGTFDDFDEIHIIEQTIGTDIDYSYFIHPQKDGFLFEGWADEDGYMVDIPLQMPVYDLNLRAVWREVEPEAFTVIYQYSGDVPEGVELPVPSVWVAGTVVNCADIPSVEGYTFDGWYYGGEIFESFVMPENDVVLTGVWSLDEFILALDASGGEFDDGSQQFTEIVPYGCDLSSVIPHEPAREGFEFAGWMDKSGIMVDMPLHMPAHNLTLVAQWEEIVPETYTVNYYLAQGGALYRSEVYEEGEVIDYYSPSLDEGLIFKGWADENGDALPEIMGTSDIDAYAVIELATYTVTFIIGKETVSETYNYGSPVNAPQISSDCIIKKWVDENGAEVVFPINNLDRNMTVTAEISYVAQLEGFDISVEYGEGCFNEEVRLVIDDLSDDKISGNQSTTGNINYHEIKADGKTARPVGFYNIKMVKPNGGVAQPNENTFVTVTMKIPEGYTDRTEFKLYHWYTTGGYEILSTGASERKITRNGDYLIFDVYSFSNFELFVIIDEAGSVSKLPKTSYYYKSGDISLSGIELKIPNGDGTYETVTDTSKMTVSGFDSSKIGKQTVTVEYQGSSAEFEVNVSYAWWQWIIRILLLGFIWY